MKGLLGVWLSVPQFTIHTFKRPRLTTSLPAVPYFTDGENEALGKKVLLKHLFQTKVREQLVPVFYSVYFDLGIT